MPNKSSNARSKHTSPSTRERTARAPYNFVPLPEKIITPKAAEQLPPLDRYVANTHTGWFDCELETCSPTYVRGMLTLTEFDKADRKEAKEVSEEEKIARAPFYSAETAEGKKVEGYPVPMIPGSSLRGLIRALVEIVSYSKMRWVNSSPKITFRAVAAPRKDSDSDPLVKPYQELIGNFGSKVRAGYLIQTSDGWEIQPALTPRQMKWRERAAYLKVEDSKIPSGAIKGFLSFNDEHYRAEWFPVSFSASNKPGPRGPQASVDQIGDDNAGFPHLGVLVCTGNMLETAQSGKESPRRYHALVLDEDQQAEPLIIGEQVLRDYRDSLTPFQQDENELWEPGGLEDGAPVFYVVEDNEVIWFGHTPNFRVPARSNKGRAVTALDFLPEELRHGKLPDLAEAIFGWVAESKEEQNIAGQHAGRVSFSDASYVKHEGKLWYDAQPIKPAILGSPKITTFQHYLVQDKSKGHDPERRATLAHYDCPPHETELRGHKLYWHKGSDPDIRVKGTKDEIQKRESQLTRIVPLRPGVSFKFRVHFENLHGYELGALAWALQLPGEQGRAYRHKLGMGKPLGMGAVKVKAQLQLTERLDRKAGRYARLFDEGQFVSGARAEDAQGFIEEFQNIVLQGIGQPGQRFIQLDRIRALLAMLEWREGAQSWLNATRYLVIKDANEKNEYAERPVLPTPLEVVRLNSDKATSNIIAKPSSQPPSQPAPGEITGVVKRFGIKGGKYGFIAVEGQDDVYVNVEGLAGGLQTLAAGQKVAFRTRPGKKGLEAYDVRLVES